MVKLTALLLLSWTTHTFALPAHNVKRHCDELKLPVPSNLPDGASRELALDFASFSIEWVDMLDYLGTTEHPQPFTINILKNLKDRTGVRLVCFSAFPLS